MLSLVESGGVWWFEVIWRWQEILKVHGAESDAVQTQAEDVSEDTAQKVAMFCVSSVGCILQCIAG